MDKTIRLIVLSSGKTLISEVEEFTPSELGDPDWKLIKPYEIDESDIRPWLESETDQTVFKIISDTIFTVADPKKELLEKYLEKNN